MRKITGEDLKNLYGSAPSELEDRVRREIDKAKHSGKEEKAMSKKTMVCIALAAVLMIGALTALASGSFNIFRMNEDASGIVPVEGASELVKQNLASVEDEYVKISVEEALFDGQSALVVYRLTPVDTEHYALFSEQYQDYDETVYDVKYDVPVPVKADDELVYEKDGESYTIPTYEKDGQLYYADWFMTSAQRTDGKTAINYALLSTASPMGIEGALSDTAHGYDDALFLNGLDAEEQADGSVLLIAEGMAEGYITDGIVISSRFSYSMDNFETRQNLNLTFDLPNNENYKDVHFEFDDPNGERFSLIEGKIHFTPLYGYITITYDYEEAEGEDMGITFRIYDESSKRISDGSGSQNGIGQNGNREIFTEVMQMQSLTEIPETLILEAKVIGEDKTLGRVTCRVVED